MKKTVVDFEAARELELYAENTSVLYYNHTLPVIENLKKKYNNGTYDKEKAVKLWEHVAETAAKMYHKEFCSCVNWYDTFNRATRHEVAKNLESVYFAEYIA